VNIQIETATLYHAGAIVALMERAYRGEESLKGWTSEDHLIDGPRTSLAEIEGVLNDPDALMLVALDDRLNVLGCVSITLEDDSCVLGKFAVSPDLQGAGLGKKLMLAAEAAAISHFGVTRMTMTVVDGRRELEAFYERRGYRQTGHGVVMSEVHSGDGVTRGMDLVLNEYEKSLLG
jgi:GNAT superfamily N-acetyltransferase